MPRYPLVVAGASLAVSAANCAGLHMDLKRPNRDGIGQLQNVSRKLAWAVLVMNIPHVDRLRRLAGSSSSPVKVEPGWPTR